MFLKRSLASIVSIVFLSIATLSRPIDALDNTPIEQFKDSLLSFSVANHIVGFNNKGFYTSVDGNLLEVNFVNANEVEPRTWTELNSISTDTQIFQQIEYSNLWEGISLNYVPSPQGILQSTYQVAAGADPSAVRLYYNAKVIKNKDGSINFLLKTGMMNESKPIAWQTINNNVIPLIANFKVYNDNEVGFALENYDLRYPITIDPVLSWSTFIGGTGDDTGRGIILDNNGNIYISGNSKVSWGTPVRAYGGFSDAFIAKLDPSGNLIWNTFLGGTGDDFGTGISLDGSGNVYVVGYSGSSSWGTPVRAYSNGDNGFAAKLDSNGNLIWNTFLGGSGGLDFANGIVLDGGSNIYISGTSGTTWGTPIRIHYGTGGYNPDAFAAKLDTSGNLIWNTFLGAAGADSASNISLDSTGNVYLTGTSDKTWGSPVRSFGFSSIEDAFVVKLSSSGNLNWNTFLGSSGGRDYGSDIVLDGSDNLYIVGTSNGGSWGSPISIFNGNPSIFIAKLDLNGNLIWNTFHGHSWTYGYGGIAVDDNNNIYISGSTEGGWSPGGLPLPSYNGGTDDAFAAELSASGNLIWNTFIGSNNDWDCPNCDIAVSRNGDVYLLGNHTTAWGSPLHVFSGAQDVSVTKLTNVPVIIGLSPDSASPTPNDNVSYTLKFSESVTGVDVTDFSLSTYGVSGASITSVSGSGNTYTIAVNTGSGNGQFTLNILNDSTIQDLSGNSITSAVYPFSSYGTYYVIRAPYALSISRGNLTPNSASTVTYIVNFSKPVTGVDSSDFSLITSGVIDASIAKVDGTGTTRTVVVNTGMGDGTIHLNLIDDDTILESFGMPLAGPGTGNGDFTSGDTYIIDKPNPQAPVLRSPMNKMLSNKTSQTFWWSATKDAQSYEFQVASDSGFSTIVDTNTTNNLSYTPSSSFADGSYFWRVRGSNGGQPGPWSSSRSFTIDTTGPSAPSLISPSNNATVRAPTFRWTTVSGAVSYQFQYDNDADFSSPVYTVNQPNTSRKMTTMATGTYHWHVRAKDSLDNWGSWSTSLTIIIP